MSTDISTDVSVDISTDVSTDISRSIYRPCVDRYVDRHIGRVSVDMSTDTSVECRSIYRPIHRSRGAQNTHDPTLGHSALMHIHGAAGKREACEDFNLLEDNPRLTKEFEPQMVQFSLGILQRGTSIGNQE